MVGNFDGISSDVNDRGDELMRDVLMPCREVPNSLALRNLDVVGVSLDISLEVRGNSGADGFATRVVCLLCDLEVAVEQLSKLQGRLVVFKESVWIVQSNGSRDILPFMYGFSTLEVLSSLASGVG